MRRIVVLEDDEDLRVLLCELLQMVGMEECYEFASVDELVQHDAEVMSCDLAILDVNLGPGVPSGVDAYRWLQQRGFRGEVVFLTGHARSHPLVRAAHALANVRILEKPVEPEVLKALTHDAHA